MYYFNKSTRREEEEEEPFSLRALAISKGRTTHISEVTPKLFEYEQEVKLKRVYKDILEEFNTKEKYKKYFSTWIVVGASWNIAENRWYYMIRYGHSVFVWVNADQIEKVNTTQKHLVEGPIREVYREPRFQRRTSGWVRGQQSLDPNARDWEAGMCEEKLRERLKRRK